MHTYRESYMKGKCKSIIMARVLKYPQMCHSVVSLLLIATHVEVDCLKSVCVASLLIH